jgi:hypothetical protein
MKKKTKHETVHYREIAPELKTGDLALFHGNSWISKAIQRFTRNPYSHVGMIVRVQDLQEYATEEDDLYGADPEEVYFFESTLRRESLPDLLIKKQVHPGVQLVSLREAFCYYDCQQIGTFNIRQLSVEGDLFYQRLWEYMKDVDARPFPKMVVMLAHWIEGLLGIPCSFSTYFCAELVAKSYEALGLLELHAGHNPANSYSPSKFSSSYKKLDLKLGGKLGDEIVILLDDCPPDSFGGGRGKK